MRWLLAVLLLAGCGVARADRPPADAVLTASQAWEQGAVEEPNVWQDHGWHMLYTGGWQRAAIGYATAPTVDGPWTKRGPVIGLGHGGWAGQAARSSILLDSGLLYVYFTDPQGSALHVAVGPDVAHLRVLPRPALAGRIVNTSVVADRGSYRMIFEANTGGKVHWLPGYADATSPTGPFTVCAFPLRSLQLSADGTAGGPDLRRTATGWLLTYHAAAHGVLPTDIYRATSTDLTRWHRTGRVVTHPAGSDQAADPYRAGGMLFFDVVDNSRGRAWIGS